MTRADRRAQDKRYAYRFGIAAFLLISGTLVLVLFVLPQRYVLSAGFRESGASFPTPATPFVPIPAVAVAARPLPQPPVVTPPGPAELFWDEVVPLLDRGDFGDALPVFDEYLARFPADRDARRERVVTLLAAGEDEAAVPALRAFLAAQENFELRLALARTLRELERTDEAALEYAALAADRPDDAALALEWARALAWSERYGESADVLSRALDRGPADVDLRIELARAYFALGRLEDAEAALDGIGEEALAGAAAIELRDGVRAALAVPPPPVEPPPTLLFLAVAARADGELAAADSLFGEALAVEPENAEVWQAYADFLEYERGDFEAAREALLAVERLQGLDPDGRYRLALLDVYTDRNAEAAIRLEALQAHLETAESPRLDGEVTVADALALRGDLDRWSGDPVRAAGRYRLALARNEDLARALDGERALAVERDRVILEVEAPRIGAAAYSLADTDDFRRVDLAGEWIEVDDQWAWGGRVGNRWLRGFRLTGVGSELQGSYAELEAARWWRWGTVRTGFQFGAERLRSTWDYTLGASLRHRGSGSRATELRWVHGPAYPLASTLQSFIAGVAHDRLTLTHSRPLGESWSLASGLDAAWLRADADSVAAGQPTWTTRLQGDVGLGRRVTTSLTVGVSARALASGAAPEAASGRPLFWDPTGLVSAGPYVQWERVVATRWRLTGRLSPGLALIDERRVDGIDPVPHVSAEAGVRHEGGRFWTSLDAFYYQGQFDGYKTYGARLTFSARDFGSIGGGP